MFKQRRYLQVMRKLGQGGNMQSKRFWMGLLTGAVALGMAISQLAGAQAAASKSAAGPQTVKGYVIDSACTFTKHLKKPISKDCAVACAKAGSDLVIQTESGIIYWPISSETPAKGQNDKLIDYAGQMVSVTGQVYTKGGSKAIVIDKVEPAQASQ
jgi:hypothetical protein